MSRASRRITTREKDIAYCLFGIFDIHLPLIYGEGDKAFIRLQEAIAQDSDDLSLFVWTAHDPDNAYSQQKYRGMLACYPVGFAHCDKLRNIHDPATSTTEGFANQSGRREPTW